MYRSLWYCRPTALLYSLSLVHSHTLVMFARDRESTKPKADNLAAIDNTRLFPRKATAGGWIIVDD